MNLQSITVNLKENAYPIYLGSQLLDDENLLRRHLLAKQVMIVTNETIAPLYLPRIEKAFLSLQCDALILPDGEQYKNFSQCQRIWDALANHTHHRDTTLIALGGGVIGDMTGFAAACYQRGVGFIQIPTSLLAQVDASIGGKTAVNHSKGKNLIGAFHQPQAVIIDIEILKTLPQREYNSGIAEIIKTALIADQAFFVWLENNISRLMQQNADTTIIAIKRACEIKRDIVIADEKETQGNRALLNLGHTFAHAIENTLGYGEWLHGEAVAVGLVLAAKFSYLQGWLSQHDVSRIQHLLECIPLPTTLPKNIAVETFLSAMQLDKKIISGQLRLILLTAIGKAVVADQFNIEDVKSAISTSS